MKLLLILPNLLLIAISGINLYNELSVAQVNKNLSVMVLHFSVLIMCLVFVGLIIKSMFKVIEVEETDYAATSGYKEIDLRHTIQM
ncbi:hypothetical protein ACX0HA_00395 [Flavobacterium hauense]